MPADKTASLECGRYIDALQVMIGDVIAPLWLGVILVAANPRLVLPTCPSRPDSASFIVAMHKPRSSRGRACRARA